ncbi:MAG: hypothetical protein AAGB46_16725 [Verrucomicrobiota bacterium]
MSRHSKFSEKKGGALALVVILSFGISLAFAGLISRAITERGVNYRHELRLQSLTAAEALVEYGFAQMRYKFDNQTSVPAEAMDPNTAGALQLPTSALLASNVDYGSLHLEGGLVPPFPVSLTYLDPDDPENEFDPLKGKRARIREIAVYASASVNDPRGGSPLTSYVTQKLQVRDAPLFAHAIFYNLDLEIHPGPAMEVYGPVHSNGDLFFQANNSLKFYNQVTTAEHLYYGHKVAGIENNQNGNVYFKNREDELKSMKIDGQWYDSKMLTNTVTDDFRSFASARWNGNLETAMHDVPNYNPVAFDNYEEDDPSTPAYDPINAGREIIEPPLHSSHPDHNSEIEDQKMSVKAGLVFSLDAYTGTVTARNKSGTAIDISSLQGNSDDADKLWEYRSNQIRDYRRGEEIDLVDLNVGKLKQLIESPDTSTTGDFIPGYNPDSDWNGIVYFEVTSSDPTAANAEVLNYSGIRLWGGETDVSGEGIPSHGSDPGMTFATNNALYVRGHFNADGTRHQSDSEYHSAYVPETGEVPVALMGDTVTFLSDNYDDVSSLSNRKTAATHTEVSAAIVAGIVPSDAENNNHLSGGAHNFPRFAESWSGQDFFLRGSMVALYESEVDRGLYSGYYYSPPKRKWGFNDLFRDGIYPPGTPLVRDYERVDFRPMTQTEYAAALAALPWNQVSSP